MLDISGTIVLVRVAVNYFNPTAQVSDPWVIYNSK